MRRRTNIILHALYWFYFSIVREISSQYFTKGGIHWNNLFSILSVSSFIIFGGIFYINYSVILPRFFVKRKFYYIGISWIAAILFFTLLRYLIEEIIFFKLFGSTNYFAGTTAGYYLYDNYIFLFDQLIISTIFWAVNHLVKNEKEKKVLLQEKFTAETAFLKSQVNPHFLFNTLNNIYSLVYQKSEQALPAILKLSELMRYNMKDSQTDKIALDKELDYIKSFIHLQTLRIQNAQVHFAVTGNTSALKIAPLLLIPFVENSFKHGITDNPDKPFEITLAAENDTVSFTVKNYIRQGNKDESSGVGLQNVQRRLQMIYPGKHQLTITNNNGQYICQLQINTLPI
jgi:two-component system, LytTR family, sensor kinase